MSNILLYISILAYVLSACCIIAAVVIFFKYDIRYVYKDLNGTIAQKEISALRRKTSTVNRKDVEIFTPDTYTEMPTDILSKVDNKPQDDDMKTSVLEFNKVISKDFIITTDIVFINTDEKIV